MDEAEFTGVDLHGLITRHFRDSPRKIALICSGEPITYEALEAMVDAIAARIAAAEPVAGGLVGICLPRSAQMVAAVIAVLRRGLAYVPLDPAFPRDRIRYMVEHARLDLIITSAGPRPLFDGAAVRLMDVADVGAAARTSAATPAPAAERAPAPAADAPAYVIYTSGSTGKPKGVVVPRGAVSNFLLSIAKRPGVGAGDVLCAVTTLSFDIAVLELLSPLCAGATVVVATEEEARDPRLLAGLLADHDATILQATPVTWQMLLATGWAGSPRLKALCGGEAMTPALARELAPRVSELWNMYGPTETTVWSTCHRIVDPLAPISVGTPIANTTLYVLDERQQPVPAEAEGRLFIGGAGVTRGYLHAEDLTAQRFVPDPFAGGEGGRRMYDTGDQARLGADGLLYIVGRSDFQVKLRGFRIELGEIEAQLSTFPAIAQVACAVRRDDPENPELVAYYVCRDGHPEPTATALRDHAGQALPAHMVPSRFRRLVALPRTPNGKLDRAALPAPLADAATAAEAPAAPAPVESGAPASPTERTAEDTLKAIWRELLGVASVGRNDNFFDLGGTSVGAFHVVQQIGARLGLDVSVLKIFEHPTVASLAAFLEGRRADTTMVRTTYDRALARRANSGSDTAFDVAIIGMAGRFPGAPDLDQLWALLRDGREHITVFSRDELDPLVPPQDRNDPSYVPARGILEGADLFDAGFFGFTPNEAELMDPQLRVFLEVAWQAFEDAGYVGERIDGEVGVWAGMGNNFYYHHNVLTRPDKLAVMGDIAAEIANEKDHIAPRVSHKLNLCGPSLSVHTACSTTLVVVENAYQALISRQVDVALAGGVDIRTPQKSGQRHEEGGPFSDDGHCRPFDAAATGTMFGEGAGAVILKRLDDAIADGDTVLAVIKGAAVNHDGSHKVSYLAPSVEGQARVIAAATGVAGISPETITYVEAHGTATPIGDPIEVEALTRVHRTFTQRRHYCALGSIKGNFGHATTAAGIAGILKVILAMRHRQIPATVHFTSPNPRIDFATSPFFVNKGLIDWAPKGIPRRAAVSSFGFCGTNAHVVLEEPPAAAASSAPARPAQLVLLSARSAPALEAGARRLADALAGADPSRLADAAYTTQVGRKRFEHRRCAVIGADAGEGQVPEIPGQPQVAEILGQPQGPSSASLKSDAEAPPVVFMFPGQGAQYVNMGLHLYRGEPVFRDAVDRCANLLAPHLGCDLRSYLFPAPADEVTATEALNNTFFTQPAIFTISYALATVLADWGIAPTAFVGHSIGEFVAATLAQVMDLESALRLVATRGRLMRDLPGGTMLSVRLPAEELQARLPAGADLAAVNAPQLCVVAGPLAVIGPLEEQLTRDGVNCRRLHTSHAFHSTMMDPVVEPFLEAVQSVRLSTPRLPFVSTVTGDWIKQAEAIDPNYWARHLRSTVQFSKAVQVALADKTRVLVECGPRRTLASLSLQHRPGNPARVIGTMPDSGAPEDEYRSLLLALGSLWLNGCEVDWRAFHRGETRRRIPLPTYAFQRKRYWMEPGAATPVDRPVSSTQPAVDAAPAAVAPLEGDALQDTIFAMVEELLGTPLEARDPDARFIALGLDSLLLTQLARSVRLRLGLEATFRDLTQTYSTPRLLMQAVRAKGGQPTQSPPPAATPATRSAAVAAPPAALPRPPTEDVEAAVFSLVEELLGSPLESRDLDARFIALGLDSLLLTQMARALRQRVGLEVTFRDLTQKYLNTRLLVAAVEESRRVASAKGAPSAIVATPPVPLAGKLEVAAKDLRGARLGQDDHGRPAWFIRDPKRAGKYLKLAL